MHTSRPWLGVFAVVLVGCSGTAAKPDAAVASDGAGSADASIDAARIDAPSGFVEADHDPAPQVHSAGGVVVAAPKIVPIFFAAEDPTAQAQITSFLTTLAGSTYWSTMATEYGVGALTIETAVTLPGAPPTTDDALQAMLGSAADGVTLPVPDANTIYTVYLPPGASLSTSFGDSCVAFGGYHDEVQSGSNTGLIYALLPRCAGASISAVDEATAATSHEFFEAATDPHPFTAPSFHVLDDAHAVWGYAPGGELGDMCEYSRAAFRNDLLGSFYVQRMWSNASAAAGHDPCVPRLSTPYIGASAKLTESLPFTTAEGAAVTTTGVTVPLNMSKTVEVDLYSDGPTSDFGVTAIDANVLFQQSPNLTLGLDRATGHNGDKLMLTITRNSSAGGGGNIIQITTQDTSGVTVGVWWGYVAE